MKYTAELVPDSKQYFGLKRYVYWGRIFNDSKERFPDGTRIHTSEVTRETPSFIITRNSVYKKIEAKVPVPAGVEVTDPFVDQNS